MSKMLLPDIYAETVFDMNISALREKGVKAFIFDIDNTLATYAMPIADDKTKEWLKSLADAGFGLYIVSNNDHARVEGFAKDAQIPCYAKALKPLGKFLRKACHNMGVKPSEAALVGDQLFTDIWGGNLMGMTTVLVKPISEVEDGFVKFKRRFERRILKKMDKQRDRL